MNISQFIARFRQRSAGSFKPVANRHSAPGVGMARCAVPARASGRNERGEAYAGGDSFRRLTLALGDGDGAARRPYQRGQYQAAPSAPARGGFTLIEFIGVMAIMAILASMLVPVVVNQAETAAINAETTNLNSMNTALVAEILHTAQIPGATNWAPTVANWLMLPTANVTTNARGYGRVYLYDTNGFGSLVLPYAQSNGLAVLPPNPRLMVISSLSANLPVISGGLGTNAFNPIWNIASGHIPATWTNWSGSANDLLIQRINLVPLFHRLVLNAVDTNIFGSYVVQSGLAATGNAYVLTNAPVNNWYLQGTVVGLYDTNNSPTAQNLELKQVMQGDTSYVFEDEAWRGQLTGWGTNGPASSTPLSSAAAISFTTLASTFTACATDTYDSDTGDSCQAMTWSFYTFMLDYSYWCQNGFQNGYQNAWNVISQDPTGVQNITQRMCQ